MSLDLSYSLPEAIRRHHGDLDAVAREAGVSEGFLRMVLTWLAPLPR